ncbi:unnamed protein product [Blepharisma stoltei]|uniref:RanBP2-type domain-containing protein n=1 Tax=Blepharisma stoltei TaxID=1481888 RepID=A0AAU9KEN9_9CILI|nr:unnamed protein product [Blepharisma stoltei]
MKPTNSIMILDIPDSIALEDIELHFNTLSESLGIPKPASINLVKAIKIAYVIFPTINSASEVFNALNENVSICGFSLQFDYAPTNSENSQQKFLSRTEWYCPKCDAYNFANRSKCYKCKFPRHSLRDPDHSELPAKEEENINATIMAKGSIVSVCDEETIFNTFAKFGKVKDVRKIRDRLSGDFRDIAFIEFYSINDADMTLEISGNSPITIEGCPITISKSRKRKTETFSQFPSNPDYGYGIPIFHTPTQIIVPQALKTLSGYEYKIPSHYAFDESCQLYYDTHTKYYWDPKTNKFMKDGNKFIFDENSQVFIPFIEPQEKKVKEKHIKGMIYLSVNKKLKRR